MTPEKRDLLADALGQIRDVTDRTAMAHALKRVLPTTVDRNFLRQAWFNDNEIERICHENR